MENFKLLLLLSCIFLTNSCIKNPSQNLEKDSKFQEVKKQQINHNQKLYASLGDHGKDFDLFLSANNIDEVKYLDEKMIIGKGFAIDYKILDWHINRIYPDPNEKGICYIDIEAPYILPLINSEENSKEFKEALQLYVNSIKYCKKKRPNVIWGHYGMPMTSFFDPDMIVANKKLQDIFKNVDVLFPSLYLYEDQEEVPFQKNYDYLRDNLLPALKIGQKFNKPVYPFIMHRFHNYKKRLQFLEMPDDYWENYVKSVLSINDTDKYADGIVWWGADTYFFTSPEEGQNVRKDFKGSKDDFRKSNDTMLLRKAKIIKKMLKF